MSFSIEELTERKSQETYPNLVILSPNETVPVIVRSLEKGEMQVIVSFNDKRKVVARISESAHNINRLLRTCGALEFYKSESETYRINTVEDYLNCV